MPATPIAARTTPGYRYTTPQRTPPQGAGHSMSDDIADVAVTAAVDPQAGAGNGAEAGTLAGAETGAGAAAVAPHGIAPNRDEQSGHPLEYWDRVFSVRYGEDRLLEGRIIPDVAACLAQCIKVTFDPAYRRPGDLVARLFGSPHLLLAIEQLGSHSMPGDDAFVDVLKTAYVTLLRRACMVGCMEPGWAFGLLFGSRGVVFGKTPAPRVPSFAHHLLALPSAPPELVYAFAGAFDATIRSSTPSRYDSRSGWIRALVSHKGYGSGQDSSFYSALAFGENVAGSRVVLEALHYYELIPSLEDCLANASTDRGHTLYRVLASVVDSGRDDAVAAECMPDVRDFLVAPITLRQRYIEASKQRRVAAPLPAIPAKYVDSVQWLAGLLDGDLAEDKLAALGSRYRTHAEENPAPLADLTSKLDEYYLCYL